MISMDYHATRIVNGGTTATVLTSLMLFSGGVILTMPLPPGIQISPACDQNAPSQAQHVSMFRPRPNLLKTQLN